MDLGAAEEWIDARLAESGVERIGPVELTRSRPWGEVASAPTTAGRVWLKAPSEATAFEVPLYGLFADLASDAVIEPIALDDARGWVLLPDGGSTLAESTEGADLIEGLIAGLRRYADLQRDLEGREEDLIGIGLTDMRPATMPARFGEALEAAGRYVERRGSSEDGQSLERIEAHGETVLSWAADLEGRPGGANLDHNDLHHENILGSASDVQTIRFYDWGDSVVAHPFAVAALPLGIIHRRAPAELERARDTYLEAWSDLGTHTELVETLELACRCAKVARALTWERAVRAAGDDIKDYFARAPLESLESLLDETYASRT